jgi:hypothetical protein
MHQRPSCTYAYCQEIQDESFFLKIYMQTVCVFPILLVMQFSYHVL